MVVSFLKNIKKVLKANVIFTKNGHGSVTNKITLPVTWVKDMGFTLEDKSATIMYKENSIIIKKEKN